MLELALLLDTELRFPPEQPTIAIERSWQSFAAAQSDRIGRRLNDSFDKVADDWIESINRVKARAEHASIKAEVVTGDIEVLSRLIDDFEAMAELRALKARRADKQEGRIIKQLFKSDPSLAASRRTFGQKLIATEKRIVEAMLDYALFLRAVRAEIDPSSRGGPAFSDPRDLQKHLEGLVAA